MVKVIDLLDQGDVEIYGKWKKEDIVGYEHYYEVFAYAYVMNEFASALGVPHGSTVRGTFWVAWDGEPDDPDKAVWDIYGFEDNFEVVEISSSLVRDLANSVESLLREKGLKKENLEDPSIAGEIWEQAWQEIKEDWPDLDRQLRRVTPGEVEELVYKQISNVLKEKEQAKRPVFSPGF